MPELPEMETYRNLLMQTAVGQTVKNAEVRREKTVNVPVSEFVARVAGRRIRGVTRRAKQLLFYLDSGDILLLHLMLGGWMYYGSETDIPAHQSQVVLTLSNGHILYFQGLRLGYLHVYTEPEVEAKLRDLGPDPQNPLFTAQTLRSALKRKRGPVKFAMVDQHTLSGIGNCYSDEACFEAEILPLRHVGELSDADFTRLYQGLVHVVTRAISLGGYMEFPFYAGDTLTGGYNDHCLVYDRGSEPCPRCGHPITQTQYNKRKVFFCEACQH